MIHKIKAVHARHSDIADHEGKLPCLQSQLTFLGGCGRAEPGTEFTKPSGGHFTRIGFVINHQKAIAGEFATTFILGIKAGREMM
ncbi:MAG TPA: hypothetical protein VFO10_19060 [Oligoflexus sp.]|nr:hypothetical protein [Oligoflexus sp.]HET9239369.1 hypothetical protein [Oligoflexus sp.]